MMIPKVIHYCWFGRKPLPDLAKKCIASWQKFLPDYEIKEWNEDNFDVNIIPYTAEAYKVRKYAFVSDYARFWILYHYGGLYFDTDVEVIRNIDDIVEQGAFMACENIYRSFLKYNQNDAAKALGVAPGLGIGAIPNMSIYKEFLDVYSHLRFLNIDGTLNQTTIVHYTSEIFSRYGLEYKYGIQEVAGVKIYPWDYFCPKSYVSGKLRITKNTRAIHHYTATWLSYSKQGSFLKRLWSKFWMSSGMADLGLKECFCQIFGLNNRNR